MYSWNKSCFKISISIPNFSEYSLDKNREMWIILKNEDVVKSILEIFKKDFTEA